MTAIKRSRRPDLGMPLGTAANRLRKAIMFKLARRLGLDNCFRCKNKIETTEEFSIEHKESWWRADDPVFAFFDLDNIAFSHLSCNCRAILKTRRRHDSKAAAVAFHTAHTRSIYDPKKRRDRYLRNGH